MNTGYRHTRGTWVCQARAQETRSNPSLWIASPIEPGIPFPGLRLVPERLRVEFQ